jgi:phenylalanyl-tRNA synthetase beta chain
LWRTSVKSKRRFRPAIDCAKNAQTAEMTDDQSMKFTLSWLKSHLETSASVAEIAATLTDLGLEVESIENPAEKLSDFTIGYVKSAERHPQADRLQVCQVDTLDGLTQIICGAPNARAGITVVVARPGTYVPGIDTTIGIGKIRGIESHGMMCSEREMELSEEHDGIIELPSGKVGQTFTEWLTAHDPARVDPVIEIAITPNRPDALGVRGIARDLAARGLGTMKKRDVVPVESSFQSDLTVSIDADTLDGCPLFCGRLIRGVKNGPSPKWLQDQLRAIGLRPISFLVDVTNWFTYDLNRPLHVFDADKVKGNLRVHRAKGGEQIVALDDKSYTLQPGQIVISDDTGVQSIAGIMGGDATGVTDETVNVFVESAYWDPVQIAYAGRALKINSDARYRFERGVDPAFTPEGLEHAVRMIVDHAGGSASSLVQAGKVPDTSRAYRLDAKRVVSLVGMEIPESTQRQTLTALGFKLEGDMAQVPSWRPDVLGEADLIEEVARIASLTKLQGQPMPRQRPGVPKPILTTGQVMARAARRTAAALGYHECVTYSFIDAKAAQLFSGGGDETMLENPISTDMSHLRPALLPGLLQAAARNQARGFMDVALFEVGDAFHGGEPGDQHQLISAVLIGRTGPKDVHGEARNVDVFDVKADVEAILAAIGAPPKAQILRGANDWWHPGRHGMICLGPKKVLAIFGELHPRILRELDIKGPAVAFTIFPGEVPQAKARTIARTALPMTDLQAVERDFAFVVDADVEALTVVNAAAGADKALIADVRVFDQFIGGSLGEGKKSLAIAVRLQPAQATLKDEDIAAVSAKIIEKVVKATGGVLRG